MAVGFDLSLSLWLERQRGVYGEQKAEQLAMLLGRRVDEALESEDY